ncbi:Peptidase propeptide and YPEB domain-containing protein [Burkholderia sp. OK233]|nr:Peptidase propeptide and YPEB domain-containing protein [Burkholderia sp. OK233]
MKRGYYFGLAATGLLITSMAAFGFTGQEYSKDAMVSLEEARATALEAHPGKIIDQELEKETGGSGLRYSFDIATNRGTQEVGVDAQTGSVLENSAEGPNPD